MTPSRDLTALHALGLIDDVDVEFATTLARIEASPDTDVLQLCAALASQWLQRGHVCLDFEKLSALDIQTADDAHVPLDITIPEPAALDPFKCVGGPGDFVPLTRAGARLYLTRYWQYEQDILQAVRSRLGAFDAMREASAVDPLARFGAAAVSPEQAAGIRTALSSRFFILTGGPGTGKTATIAKLLCSLLEQEPGTTFALCAPTGKAAARLDESLGRQIDALDCTPELRAYLLDAERRASTIHRLLGARGDSPYFRHDRDNRLPHRVVIVDEASMVDVALMAKLVTALRDDTQLILVGDKDQLASVDAGSVFGDLCEGVAWGNPGAADLRARICVLHENFRAKDAPGIVAFAQLLTSKTAPSMADVRHCVEQHKEALCWRDDGDVVARADAAFMQLVRDSWAGLAQAEAPEAAFAQFRALQILAAVRAGPQGVDSLNDAAKMALGHAAHQLWYPGRPVLVTRNDYTLGLYNGDIGIAFQEHGRYFVWFESASGAYRRVAVNRLPPHETAYAITIHKSQGTEAEHVLMVLPERDNPILTRELVYTGATRAQRRLDVWASEAILEIAVSRRTLRISGLGEKLWGTRDGA